MILKTLSQRLLALWLMLLASAVASGFLMTAFFRQSSSAQVERAEDFARRACLDIADRYAFFSAGAGSDPVADVSALREQLRPVVERALARAAGVEGGVWSQSDGSLAYAFPTYEGGGPKTDLPAAEASGIAEINARAERSGRPETQRKGNASQVLVLHACPLSEAAQGLTAWTMTRVFTGAGAAYERLLIGLSVLAATVLGSALWLGYIMIGWSRRVRNVEQALGHRVGDEGDVLALTGERDLDRLIEAVNVANQRTINAQRAAAADQRLAAVGMLAAGVAHEIRNPIAAMRLKTENALATGDRERGRIALEANLAQIGRLDRILTDLLAVTEAPQPRAAPVDLVAFCAAVAADFQEIAHQNGLTLTCLVDPSARHGAAPTFDEEQVRRAVRNLLANAVQHTPSGGCISCVLRRAGDFLQFIVEDTGVGVAEPSAQRIFEPFVTGRPDGTGLGLAIVRETARAHGGDARLAPTDHGARFEIEIPWTSRPS